MKQITKYINESYYETDSWTYLFLGSTKTIDFFQYGMWNPHEITIDVQDRFVVVTTKKDTNIDSSMVHKAWQKKYDEDIYCVHYILCSHGDLDHAKKIKKIGSYIDKGKIALEDLLIAIHDFKGNADDLVEQVYNKIEMLVKKP